MIAVLSVTGDMLARVDTGNEPGTVAIKMGEQPWGEILACHARALAAALLHYADELERRRAS